MILFITYIYIFMVLSALVMLGIHLYNRQQELSKNNLELRRRIDISEIRDDDLNRKLDRVIDNLDSIANKVYESSVKISNIEKQKPLD